MDIETALNLYMQPELGEMLQTYVSHLECSATGKRYPARQPQGLSDSGKPLWVRYDLDKIRQSVSQTEIAARQGGFWKYRELLPVTRSENIVSLGEVMTPLISL